MTPKITELWCCENCGEPAIIEDGGFAPQLKYVKYAYHPVFKDRQFNCAICGHDAVVKVRYIPTYSDGTVWAGTDDQLRVQNRKQWLSLRPAI